MSSDIRAAALDPARVAKLVVIGIPHPATLKPTPINLWRVRHFVLYKLPGAARRFAADDFAALPAICKRWSPLWSPSTDELAPVRAAFSDPASLDAALGYYRALRFRPPAFLRRPITVPTIAFAGLDDPNVSPADYAAARRMFQADYAVEEMRGGHFMHREYPTTSPPSCSRTCDHTRSRARWPPYSTAIEPTKPCAVHMKLKVPALSNSRHAVLPKSTISAGSVGLSGLGATLCAGDITNLTRPCALIVVIIGVYMTSLSLVVTVGMSPGGQVTVRTLGAAASPIAAASGFDEELELLHAARIRQASDGQTRMA
ncbi:MAG TPA: alpha/beta hydrolase [Kofleriaceae bacterium]